MKSNILGLLLIINLTLLFNYSYGQILTYNRQLECEVVVPQDTIVYYFEDDKGKPYYRRFPINSNISFKTDFDELFLHSSSAEIINDTLTIYMTKQSFGLIIDVKIQIINNKPITSISYWTALTHQSRILKTDKVILVLKEKDLRKGDNVIGNVNITFRGKLLDEVSMKEKKITGKIDGCFNIQINKLLKSRYD